MKKDSEKFENLYQVLKEKWDNLKISEVHR